MKQVTLLFQTALLTIVFIFLLQLNTSAQVREPLNIQQTTKTAWDVPIVSPFKLSTAKKDFKATVKAATHLQLDAEQLNATLKKQPREFIFQIPQKDGSVLQVSLKKQDILAPDFEVTDQDGIVQPYQPGNYYTGHVLDRQVEISGSIAALSIVDGEIMAMMNVNGKNLVLGALKDDVHKKASEYILYNDANLVLPNNFTCGTDLDKHLQGTSQQSNSGAEKAMASNIVKVQFEADYRMYQDFGSSIANTSNYITGLFNMVATIYHLEEVVTQISKIVVWNIPDPYNIVAGTTSGDVLNAYRARKNLTGINGDLGHLLSTMPLGHGGIAWVDVLCHAETGVHTAYSNISMSYKNFPLYSWTVDVVTHEMGHNLGSGHTHDCIWGPANNQTLDNCFAPSGGCAAGPAPQNGGTIMSYCHLTAAGKNFNLGFGNEPGDRIRSRVNAATCLDKAFLDCGNAVPIHCGETVNGTTKFGVNNVNTYGCKSWKESGKEKVYILQTTEKGTITATLSNETADLDIIILNACSESDCLAQGMTSVSVPNAPAGLYFIVVDGYRGAEGNFTLSVNCSGYCFTTGLTNYEFINRVKVGSLDNHSGNNYGYGDFTGIGTQLQRGGSTPVSLTPGFISSPYSEVWRIWIDANQDEDFNDAGELVFTGGPSSGVVNGNLSIPASANLGKTRMRVAMRYNSAPNDCGIFSGEVEDYTVEILPYCPSFGITKYEFIDKVEIKEFVNVSGNNMGYADFTGLSTIDLIKGEHAPISLTPGFNGFPYPEKWSVWIDYNHDFYFDDVKELVFSTSAGEIGTVEGKFWVANGAPTGKTRMRITMHYGESPSACSYQFYGETEDYLVNIIPFCAAGGDTNYEYIQTAGIGSLLNDSGDDGGYADYTDLYMEATAGNPTGLVLAPGFTGSEYAEYWRVWIDYNGDKSFDHAEMVFAAGPDEDMVFGAFVIPDSIGEGAYGLRVALRYGGFPSACGEIGSGEVEDYTITILGNDGSDLDGGLVDRSSGMVFGSNDSSSVGDIDLFPNPARALVSINWNDVQPVAGQLISATGQSMMSFDSSSIPVRFDVSQYPTGLYMLQVITVDKQMITKRIVKVD